MKKLAQLISWLALAATLAPALTFFAGKFTLDQAWTWMLAATILWFATAPFWMEHQAS